jgi:hypothetical protein
MVTAILKVVEITLLQYLLKKRGGGKDIYVVTGGNLREFFFSLIDDYCEQSEN